MGASVAKSVRLAGQSPSAKPSPVVAQVPAYALNLRELASAKPSPNAPKKKKPAATPEASPASAATSTETPGPYYPSGASMSQAGSGRLPGF